MTTESSPPAESRPKPPADRWIKLGFAAVAIAIVGWLILHQHMESSLPGWSNDLPAALAQARLENRKLVAVVYDSPQNHDYKKLRVILTKKGNVEAMDDANVLRVQTSLGRRDPLIATYEIEIYPTTLLIGPDGKVITRWTGYIGETVFRSRFLKGKSKY